MTLDRLGRPLRDLRISVTDRCNFRCVYCMPKSVFGAEYRFLDRKELLTFEEIERVARAAVALGVREIAPHRRRAARAQGRRAADRDARAARRRADADDQRLAARGEGAGARRRGAASGDRQPRLARRCDLPRDERRRLPGVQGAGRDRGGGRRRAAGEGERGRQARPERGRDPRDGPLLPRAGPHAPLHRVHGRRRDERLAARRRRPGGRADRTNLGGAAARAGRGELPGRGREALALRRRQRRDRRDRVRDAALLRRLHARADLGRGPALHLSLRAPRPRPPRADPRRRLRRGAAARRSARSGASAPTATPSCARRRR